MSAAAPALNSIQKAWLQEIGIDARMLAHFRTDAPFSDAEPAAPTPMPTPAPSTAGEVQGEAPQAAPARDSKRVERLTSVAELLKRPGANPADARAPVQVPAAAPHTPSVTATATLSALREHVAACTACGLHEVRSRTVFGEGVEASPRWMFIGEAPGEYDESVGRPFQGRAGELLQAMLEAAGMSEPAQSYFTNVLKCRPMGNRSPEPAEIAACLPLLRRQISLVQPACLIALGRVSAAALLGRDDELDVLRGQLHEYVDDNGRRIPVVVTHHPATLLLHAQYKADAWRDLQLMSEVSS